MAGSLSGTNVAILVTNGFDQSELTEPKKALENAGANDNEQQAIEARKTYWAGTFVPALFTERIYTSTLSQQNGNAVGADTIRETVCISNDSEAHIKIARRYIDLGFDHLVFHSAGPDQRAFLEAYGRHVLPRLRGAQRLKIAVCKN